VLPALGWAVLRLGALACLILIAGGWAIPRILFHVARTRSRELFTLSILAIALVIATGSAHFFGASMALGAFLAGMVVGQSEVSHQAAADALPMRDAFAVLFFVSVGMLFDPAFVVERPGLVLAALAIILVGKPLAALVIVALLGYSARTALTVAVGLAQIGEFSFILADAARGLDVLPREGQSLLVAGALISISLNPLLFRPLALIERRLRGWPRLWALLNRRAEARGRAVNEAAGQALAARGDGVHAVVVGYGPVGQTVHRILRGFEIRPAIIDLNVDTAARLSAGGELAIYGDASRREILLAAGIDRARFLVVALPDRNARIPIIITARSLNPDLRILVRARYLQERSALEGLGVTAVSYEEAEAAAALAELLLREVGADEKRVAEEVEKVRLELARPQGGPK
jgi:CPA2 family monovalent cation:H+ antiporter-2